MLRYIKEILGMSAKQVPWQDEKNLPVYLQNGKVYSILTIDETDFLAIEMEATAFHMNRFKKQLIKLKEYWNGLILLCFNQLTSYQRSVLIQHKISFIVPGSQLYIPVLGMQLQERMAGERKQVTKLSPAAQYLFLHLLYQRDKIPMTKVQLAKELNVSAMTITRACQELLELKLIQSEKSGRNNYVQILTAEKEVYQKAKPYLINPVQKRVFVKKQLELESFPLSGEAALAEMSMLNRPATKTIAMSKKQYNSLKNLEIINPAWYVENDYVELEIWKYDPQPLAQNHMADVISVMLSLAEKNDERLEQAIEDIMEEYKW